MHRIIKDMHILPPCYRSGSVLLPPSLGLVIAGWMVSFPVQRSFYVLFIGIEGRIIVIHFADVR